MSKKKIRKKKDKAAAKSTAAGTGNIAGVQGRKNLISITAILLITFIAFFPSLNADFVNWDDDYNILNNENLNRFDWDHIKGIFTSTVIGNYNPLSIFTFAIEKHFFGLDPFVFHLNNILLHLVCVFLVFKLGLMLKLNSTAAIILTALFAIHPMRVESVTWVTERKDVLFAAFYFWALLIYARGVLHGRKKWDAAAILALFILSGLSKIQAVSLPLSMLAIDYLAGRKIQLKLVLEKAHYFIISLAIGLAGIVFLKMEGSLEATAVHGIVDRFFIGMYSYTVYVVKSIYPYQMSPLYPYNDPLKWHEYLGIPGVLLIGAIAWYLWKNNKKVAIFGLLFFTFNIMFLLQVLGAGQGYLADRFTYVAYFGLFFAYAFYIEKGIQAIAEHKRKIAFAGLASIGLLYSYWTFQQTKIWENSGTLWSHVIQYYPNTPLPFGNRANFYRDEGMLDEALADYSRAIQLDPQRHASFNSRGKLRFDNGQFELALEDYQKAISIEPNNGEYHTNLGATLGMMGRIQEAIEAMSRGLELRPNFAQGYANRAVMYNQVQQHDLALQDLNTYTSLDPFNADIWYEKGRTHRFLSDLPSALDAYSRAIQLDSSKGIFFLERSRVHYQLGNLPQAREDMQAAENRGSQIDPNYRAMLQ
ncbi:MAG: tetratricopeptide repeat protein [Saprospirales bacterium]|nr:MAG: tetratricopeptide repeat protein [Saprospirales bacterium]